jgi:hypothetical protein
MTCVASAMTGSSGMCEPVAGRLVPAKGPPGPAKRDERPSAPWRHIGLDEGGPNTPSSVT